MDDKELPAALRAAEADSRRLRDVLTRVEAGRADVQVGFDSLTEHWREHGGTYKVVGRLVLNQLRVELLAQLYGWRDQLDQQLQARKELRQANGRTGDP